ncbi:hypothetical protein LBMAG26_08030 [Bacteroidota bacterium]|nr:hypothetical protein LBMAG26_08030 [Bacteroidota bacterium]
MNGGDEGQRAETDFAITNKKYFASAAKNHQKIQPPQGAFVKENPPRPSHEWEDEVDALHDPSDWRAQMGKELTRPNQ